MLFLLPLCFKQAASVRLLVLDGSDGANDEFPERKELSGNRDRVTLSWVGRRAGTPIPAQPPAPAAPADRTGLGTEATATFSIMTSGPVPPIVRIDGATVGWRACAI